MADAIGQHRQLGVHARAAGQHQAAARSRLLPGSGLALLASFVERAGERDRETMRAFRDAVRRSRLES